MKIRNFFFVSVLFMFGLIDPAYPLCLVDFSTPTTTENVSAKAAQLIKYRDFAQDQLSKDTAMPKFASIPSPDADPIQERWEQTREGFLYVLQHYNTNEFSEGDDFLKMAFTAGFDAVRKMVGYWVKENGGTHTAREELDNIIVEMTDHEGSPVYYPNAQSNFDLIPEHCFKSKIFTHWKIDVPEIPTNDLDDMDFSELTNLLVSLGIFHDSTAKL